MNSCEKDTNNGEVKLISANKLPETLSRLVEKEKCIKKIIYARQIEYSKCEYEAFDDITREKEQYFIFTDKFIIVGTRLKKEMVFTEHDEDLYIHVFKNENVQATHLYSNHIVIDIEYGNKCHEVKIPFDDPNELDDIMFSIWCEKIK